MGCGSSQAKESELMALCRERKELIAAAADRRYKLAAAHAAYFHALDAVGDALHRFLREEVSVSASAALTPGSPVLNLPPSDGNPKHKRKTKSKSKFAGDESTIAGSHLPLSSGSLSPAGSHLPLSSGSLSPAVSHLPLSSGSLSPAGSHLPLSSGSESEPSPDPSPDPSVRRSGGGKEGKGYGGSGGISAAGGGSGGGEASTSTRPPPYSVPNPNSTFMRSSTGIPTMVYQGQYAASDNPHNGNVAGFGYPSYGGIPNEREDPMPPGTPPPASPLGISSWEFFNPFNSYERFLPDYSQAAYGVSTFNANDLKKVREQEGIPELEEEPEVEPVRESKKEKKLANDDSGGNGSSVARSKKVPPVKNARNEKRNGTASTSSKNGSSVSRMKNDAEDKGSNDKKTWFTDISSYITEESGPSGDRSISGSTGLHSVSVHPKKNVVEVVEEIAAHFRLAVACGAELSKVLEVGKLPYQSRSRIHEVVSSSLLDPVTLCLLASSYPPFKRSTRSTASNKSSTYSNSGSENQMTSGRLSSTLEKLYIWEKKLYKEVKEEERLRISYDKKYKQLKALDEIGIDSSKIRLTHSSIRKLQTKRSIVLASVDAISSKMHEIRDRELQPQLIELIQGFFRMWNFVLDFHQKQLQALADSKSLSLVVRTKSHRKSVAKATKELELKLVKWCNCFNDWISIQKSYTEALNGWLMKWLPEEEELTPDGVVPFSPSKIGAPSVFIFSNDWYQALKSISTGKVINLMNTFAAIVHLLWENQRKEQKEKLEAEYLSRTYDRKLTSLKKRVAEGHLAMVSGTEDRGKQHDDALVALRKKLDGKRAKHKETLKRVQDIASKVLPTLLPTVEELESFTSETLKAYNEIRIPSEGGEV